MENTKYKTLESWLDSNPLLQWRMAQGIDGTALPMRAAAERCDISYNSIWLWENDKFMPKYHNFQRMADAMQYEGGADALYTAWQAWRDAKPAETATPVAV